MDIAHMTYIVFNFGYISIVQHSYRSSHITKYAEEGPGIEKLSKIKICSWMRDRTDGNVLYLQNTDAVTFWRLY